jgi:hypothetical protein
MDSLDPALDRRAIPGDNSAGAAAAEGGAMPGFDITKK